MSEKRPDIEWVAEQWPPLGKIDAGPPVQALAPPSRRRSSTSPSAPTSRKFVREGNTRGLFKDRAVVSLLTGEPEYLDPLKDEAPEGWIVTGYPWYAIKTPDHDKFLKAYQAKFNDYPRLGSIVGYPTMKAVAAIIAKAGSTDTEKLIAATEGICGRRAVRRDHLPRRSTTSRRSGAFVGKTGAEGRQGRDGRLASTPTAPTTCRATRK